MEIKPTTYYRFQVDHVSYSILFVREEGEAEFPYMVAILDSRNTLIRRDWMERGRKPSAANAQVFAEKHEQWLRERQAV